MQRLWKAILGEDGQDLVEYSLLVAFVALASAGLFLGSGASVNQVWTSANTVLSTAAAGPNPATDNGGGHTHDGGGGH